MERLQKIIFIVTAIALSSCTHYNKHNIGYIDPSSALGNKDFKTCSDLIYEYYNPTRASYKYGKRVLVDSITNKYTRIYKESGYLTIRFVINCKGESGRYEILENNLNLEPKKFSKQLVDQLFGITQELTKWNPVLINSEPKDAYMYITYKLKDGFITEVLP